MVIALPSEGPATSIMTADTANRSAGWLGPDGLVAETGDGGGMDVPSARPDASQPTVSIGIEPRATPTPAPTLPPTHAAAAATSTSSAGAWNFDPDVSWYGPGFYGGRTACGQALTTSLVGVASLRYPCGTLITFRNPANGRTVTAPVVDHGPYVTGRIWDMTGGLCVALDHCYTGSMYWRVAGG